MKGHNGKSAIMMLFLGRQKRSMFIMIKHFCSQYCFLRAGFITRVLGLAISMMVSCLLQLLYPTHAFSFPHNRFYGTAVCVEVGSGR